MSTHVSLTRSTLLIMAFATGASVANIYYNQPLLDQIRESFGTSAAETGWVPTLTQVGYALGMLFLVPLGDKYERKFLVTLACLISIAALALLALATQFWIVAVASFLVGISTMTPQFLIPFAASLVKPSEKGKTVGTMMSGLLLGILLARTVSGFVGASFGWRAMFGIAGGFQLLLLGLLLCSLPKSSPSYHGKYAGLLKSVIEIFRDQPVLQEASVFGGLLFGSFSAFWATLIYLVESPAFHLGARSVGLFGLLGAVAAGATPLVGSVVDRKPPRQVTGIMIVLTMISFLVYAVSEQSLIGIGLGVVLMDLGVQGGHVSNQSRIFALIPSAQSRIQTAYMFFYFAGGAIGSYLGTWAWSRYGWIGVCATAMVFLALALLRFLRPHPEVQKLKGSLQTR